MKATPATRSGAIKASTRGNKAAHREANQHEALGRGVEHAPRHAFERRILVDVAVMDRAERVEARDHVGPQVLVAHEAGQQDEVAQTLGYFFRALNSFPESVTKPKH